MRTPEAESTAVFYSLLRSRRAEWEDAVEGQPFDSAVVLVGKYRELLVAENEVQNLTRILDPEDFFENNLSDVVALSRSGFLGTGPCFDLGSGGGVPGLLSACVSRSRRWLLCDSEKKKADFLRRAAFEMGLTEVAAQAGRAEEILKSAANAYTIVSRAVGPVERIFNWIANCSTWNRLVLLKGPNWDTEWATFRASSKRNQLEIAGEYPYLIKGGSVSRRLILLERR